MMIDWSQKELTILYQGQYKLLKGVPPESPQQLLLQLDSKPSESPSSSSQPVPVAIQELDQFPDLF